MKNYPGNKAIYGTYHKIINEIPRHKIYIELFAGSGSICKLLHDDIIPGDTVEIYLNDIDSAVTAEYNFKVPVKVYNLNCFDIFKFNIFPMANTDTFIFMDPPYEHETRKNNTKIYTHEFTRDDHIKLLNTVRDLKCNWMLIHPDCKLYNEALEGFRKVQLKIRYNRKTSIENLYMNYDTPDFLQTTKYIGVDCWDRQRIKRKSDRTIQKISSLPPGEKQFILSAIKNKFFL